MARLRLLFADAEGRERPGPRERLSAVSGGAGAKRFVDSDAAVEGWQPAA
jgi:hypothetical protein